MSETPPATPPAPPTPPAGEGEETPKLDDLELSIKLDPTQLERMSTLETGMKELQDENTKLKKSNIMDRLHMMGIDTKELDKYDLPQLTAIEQQLSKNKNIQVLKREEKPSKKTIIGAKNPISDKWETEIDT